MIVGLVGLFAFSYYAKFIAPMPMYPSIYGFALSLAAMIVVSLATKVILASVVFPRASRALPLLDQAKAYLGSSLMASS